jgi:hypothetical protein
MKVCSKCNESKPLEAFGNLKRGKDGKCSYCKQCANKALRLWEGANKEHIRERTRKYSKRRQYDRDNKTDWYFRECLRNNVRRYIIDKRGKRTEEILGETFDNVRLHIQRRFKENMSWSNYGEWHIDHIIPLSSGKNRDEWIKLNHYSNLQPLWAEENMRKKARLDWNEEAGG